MPDPAFPMMIRDKPLRDAIGAKARIAALKRTASGEGLFVTSGRIQNQDSIRPLLKDKEILVDRR